MGVKWRIKYLLSEQNIKLYINEFTEWNYY